MFPTLSRTTLACVLLGAQAICHAQNDQGKVSMEGRLVTTTCVLKFDNSESASGGKTLSFGNIPVSKIPKKKYQTLDGIASKTIIFSVTSADGSTCNLAGNWDLAINIEELVSQSDDSLETDVMQTSDPKQINSAMRKMGIYLATTKNGTVGQTKVLFRQKKLYFPYGAGGTAFTLLSSSANKVPSMSKTDKLALTVKFMTTADDADSAIGEFSATIPIYVFYP